MSFLETRPDQPGKVFFTAECGGQSVADFNTGEATKHPALPRLLAEQVVACCNAAGDIPVSVLNRLRPGFLAELLVAHAVGSVEADKLRADRQ